MISIKIVNVIEKKNNVYFRSQLLHTDTKNIAFISVHTIFHQNGHVSLAIPCLTFVIGCKNIINNNFEQKTEQK